MRFTLLLLLVLLLPIHGYGQEAFETQLPIVCGNSTNMLRGLEKEYDEEIVFLAAGATETREEIYHTLWINIGNQTWSFVAVNKDRGIACVIASGEQFKMFFPGNEV
jgi:hypothetical protein